jgi:PemK-like, MazF-like toxin of type II toxin-antitoxin system
MPGHWLVVPLTSQLRGLRGEVDIGKPRWLPKRSAVNVQSFASIDRHALIRKLGTLSDAQLSAAKDTIRKLLELWPSAGQYSYAANSTIFSASASLAGSKFQNFSAASGVTSARYGVVDLPGFVDLFGRIAFAPTALAGPSEKGSKVSDGRVTARGFLVFGDMFTDLFVSNLVDIDFGRKPFRQQAQKGLIADDSLLGCAAVFLSRQERLHRIRQWQ